MKKRILTLLLALTMICSLFTACGSSESNNQNDNNNQASNNQTVERVDGPDVWNNSTNEVYIKVNRDKFITSEGIYFGMYHNVIDPDIVFADVTSIIYNGREYKYEGGQDIIIRDIVTCLSDEYITFCNFSDFRLNSFSLEECETLAIKVVLHNVYGETVDQDTVNLYPIASWKFPPKDIEESESKSETETESETETVTYADDTVIEFKNTESYDELDRNKDGIITYAEIKKHDYIEWKEDNFDNLKYFPKLYTIRLNDANKIESLDGIEAAKTVTYVDIESNSLKDISAISNLNKLWYLNIEAEKLEDISPIGQLENLEEVWLEKVQIKDLTIFSTLKKLRGINIRSDSFESLDGIDNIEPGVGIYIESSKITEEDVKEACERVNREYSKTAYGGFSITKKVGVY